MTNGGEKGSVINFNYVIHDFKLWLGQMQRRQMNSPYKGDTDLLTDVTLQSYRTNRSIKGLIYERN